MIKIHKNKRTYQIAIITSFIVTFVFAAVFFLTQNISKAASLANWDAGYIISDDIFTNKNAMTASQIQQFLNSKVPVCDTNGTQPSEYGGGTRAQWGTARGYPPPYTCLKDYSQNGKSAAQIIYDVSQQYSINPQVLIVLLQKEQSLVTDTWPLSIQYRSATGYGCPDTAACDSTYYGFTNQVTWAAKMFRSIMNQSPTWYSPYVLGNNFIRWSPNSACGGSTVNIRNLATVALYDYTPYQPNQAALNAGYGNGDSCSAHGNRNFYLYFNDWFGSTISPANYSWSSNQQIIQNGTTKTTNTAVIGPGGTVKAVIKAKNTGNRTWYRYNTMLGTTHKQDRSSAFRSGDWLAANRPARLQEASVSPGETGTFSFTFTAPNSLFSSREYFNILTEGVQWHKDIGFYYDIHVRQPTGTFYNVKYESKELYSNSARTQPISSSYNNVVAGSTIYGKIRFKNTGNNTLEKSFTFLATDNPRDRTSQFRSSNWASSNRVATMVENSVAPGETGTILFTLKAPVAYGRYSEAFGMVAEGRSWMDIDKVGFTMSVVGAPRSTMTKGTKLYVNKELRTQNLRRRLLLQNDGNLVLYNQSKPLWNTGTSGTKGAVLILQNDGNLVLYGPGNRPLWNSGTAGKGGNYLIFQDDGNLVLYRPGGVPVWASNTR